MPSAQRPVMSGLLLTLSSHKIGDVVLILCSDASQALQGSLPVWANCVDRPQTTGELASADVTVVTKFCDTSGIFKILKKRQSLYVSQLCTFKYIYYWNSQLNT